MAVEPHDTMSHESILIGRLASGSCAFVKSGYVCLRLRVSSWSWPYRPAAWHWSPASLSCRPRTAARSRGTV